MRGPPFLRCACLRCSTPLRAYHATPLRLVDVGPEADAARREARATSERRAPRTDTPLTHFVSPRAEKCGPGGRIGQWIGQRGRLVKWRPAARLFLDCANEGNDVCHIIGAEAFGGLHLSNAFGDSLR